MRRTDPLTLALCLGLLAPRLLFGQTPDHQGAVIQPVPLGVLVAESRPIVVLEVDKTVPEKGLVIFKPVAALAGEAEPGLVRHHAGQRLVEWACPGKKAICFYHGAKAVTCVDNYWYYCWNFGEHADPPVWTCADWVAGFAHSYVGPVDRLREHVAAILDGREVVVTAQAPEDTLSFPRLADPIERDWLRGQKGRVWRIKAGLKVTRPVRSDDSPDFVGWGVGGEEVVPSLVQSLHSKDPRARAEAAGDLGGLGPLARPGLPALRQALRDADPFVRLYATAAVARVDPDARPELPMVTEVLNTEDPALRRAAVGTLAALGVRAQAAVPDLIQALRHDGAADVRRGAAFALGKLAPEASPAARPSVELPAALAAALEQDRDKEVRFEIVRALLRWGARAWVAGPALSRLLKDSDDDDPAAALAADLLARLDPPAVEVLADALRDPRCGVRSEIAARLGELGPRARAATPALRAMFRREERADRRWQAAWALLRIDPQAPVESTLPALMGASDQPPFPQDDCTVVIMVLAQLGARAKPAVPVLAAMLEGHSRPDRRLAADALGKIGPCAAEAAPTLRRTLEDRDPSVRVAAAGTLWCIGDQRSATPVLVQGLRSNDPEVRASAARILGAAGPDAAEAVPALKDALGRENDPARARILLAFWRVEATGENGRARRKAAVGLSDLLDRSTSDEHSRRVREWGDKGPWFPADDPLEVWKEEKIDLADGVTELVRRLSVGDNPVPVLAKATRHKSLYVRLAAVAALARTEPGHPDVMPAITRILEQHPALFWYLADTLAGLGPKAKPVVPWLQRALRDEDSAVYRVTAAALRRIDAQAVAGVWDASALRPAGGLSARTPEEWETLWAELAQADATTAYRASWTLAEEGSRAVPYLREWLRPIPAVPPAEIARLIEDLDSDAFATREKASAALEEIVDLAEPALRKALHDKPSPEARRRIEQLLDRLDPAQSPRRRRALRAVAGLEKIGSPEARELLDRLAHGAEGARLTREARASLERLAKQPVVSP